ncbi:MAG: iron-containing redox enzyme family protein [Thermoanaerobaculia bacterium]|nr:iron-containing redox enzyme family protein [Thermoanaerobaculia bacterium]
MSENPFIVSLRKHEVSREQLRRYLVNLASLAVGFPQVVSSVLGVCRDERVRHHLIANLLEEEGITSFEHNQIHFDPARSHAFLAKRLARAAGETEEVRAHVPTPWFRQKLASGSWLAPFAYFAIGHEANIPLTFRLIIDTLSKDYGFDDASLEFLTEHVTADERHGHDAAEMIAAMVRNPEDRAEALEGARRGGLSWWGFHKSFARFFKTPPGIA